MPGDVTIPQELPFHYYLQDPGLDMSLNDACTQVLEGAHFLELFPNRLDADFHIVAAAHHDLALLRAHFHSN